MASKTSIKRAGPGMPSPPHSSTSAQLPSPVLQLAPESKISAFCISLSLGFTIHFSAFSPVHGQGQGHLDIDLARRRVFESNAGRAVQDSLLTHSQINKEESAFWVFCIEQHRAEADPNPVDYFNDLDLNGLTRKVHDKFSYADLYPCSAACLMQRIPCPTCLLLDSDQTLKSESDSPSTPVNSSRSLPVSCRLPRHPLRQPLAFFLDAVRERIIHDICEDTRLPGLTARRLSTGILCGPSSPSGNWTDGWDQHWKTRPLSFCQIETTLFASGILIQPHFRPTHFLPFIPCPALSLLPGTPITLLPFSTPAYILNVYSGPTGTLTRQFEANLVGLGAGRLTTNSSLSANATAGSGEGAQFIIVWLNVQNKQGEEKGLLVIWPAVLCVSLMSMPTSTAEDSSDSASISNPILTSNSMTDNAANPPNTTATSRNRIFAYGRKPLSYIPELPLALQASPVPAPAIVPYPSQARAVSPSLFTPIGMAGRMSMSLSREATPTTPFPPRSATQSVHPIKSNSNLSPSQSQFPPRPPLIHATSSFPPHTTHLIRSLSLPASTSGNNNSSDMRKVAENVGRFVDFMAKERERERERIRREKERETSAGAQASSSINSQGQGTMIKGLIAGVGTPQSPGMAPPLSSSATPSAALAVHAGVSNVSIVPEPATPNPAQSSTPTSNQQPPVPVHHPSYPSPPEECGGKADQIANNSLPASVDAHQAQAQTAAPSASFDSFDGMDKFIMDLGMGMGMDMKVDFDSLGVFTDDDFSFFDDPVPVVPNTSASATAASTTAISNTPLETKTDTLPSEKNENVETPASMGIPSLGQSGLQSSVPDSAAPLTPFDKSSPWAVTKKEHRNHIEGPEQVSSTAPDLLPGSPDESSASSAGPATPEIFTSDAQTTLDSETNTFDPIRFSKRLHSVDAKYAIGKFSSSLIEKDSPASIRETPMTVLWRMSYDSRTDPRIEVVKKLIGIKRRLSAQGIRLSGPPCPPFQDTARSEWESMCVDDDVSLIDVDSERDSDEEDQILDEHEAADSVSRPSTPLASYLPLGPTLLSTQFQHSLLLPLSVNLWPPGASFAATLDMASPLPNPVPTPVSPAALAGSTNEKSKSLEVIVRALAHEVVENVLWETAWRASSLGQALICRQGDYEQINDGSYFLSTGWPLDPMHVASFCSFASSDATSEKRRPSFKALEQPMFTVGKGNILVQMSPPALRFWSKTGLTPRSGPKDVSTFILYEDGGRPLSDVEKWMNCVSWLYSAKGYGKHSLGKSGLCFLAIRYATFRKSLASLVDSLGSTSLPIVIYIVTPLSILSLSSPILRQIFTSINRVLSSRPNSSPPILFHLVPDPLLTFKDDITYTVQFETFVDNVYNRVPRPVGRFMSRPFLTSASASDSDGKTQTKQTQTRRYFEAPSFILSRTTPLTTSLSFQYPPPDISSVDRHTLLHVGYKLTTCKRWLVAACIDQRGEGHDLGVWSAGDDGDWKQLVSQVWTFAMEFAKRANAEWRVVITKLGVVEEAELEAWGTLLNSELQELNKSSRTHVSVSLLCVDDESGWTVLPEQPSPSLGTLSTLSTLSRQSQKPPSSTDSHNKSNIPTQTQGHGHGHSHAHGHAHGYAHAQTLGQGQGQAHGQGQHQGQLLTSISSSYIFPSLRCPIQPPSSTDLNLSLGAGQYIPEEDDASPHSHSLPSHLRPLLTSALLTIPSPSPSSSSSRDAQRSQTQLIHFFLTLSSPHTTLSKSPVENLADICQNYHDLTVLTQSRWQWQRHLHRYSGGKCVLGDLPYHLAALRIVDSAIDMHDITTASE